LLILLQAAAHGVRTSAHMLLPSKSRHLISASFVLGRLMAFGAFDQMLAKNKGGAKHNGPEDPSAIRQRRGVYDKSCKALSLHSELETLCREAHQKGLYVRPSANEMLARPMTPMGTLKYRADYRPPNTAIKTQSARTLQTKLFPIVKQHH
jgi:hypothetical protein